MVITLVARNLAARQRAADVLHAERERFRTTLTSIGDAVVVTDAQGRVTLLNPVAQALTGWGGEALASPWTTVFRIVNEATRETVENPVSKVIRLGTIVGLANHTVLIAKDGTRAAHRRQRRADPRRARPHRRAWCWSSATSPSGGARSARWRTPTGARTSSSPCWPTSCATRSRPIRNAAHTLALLGDAATTGCAGSRASSSGRSGS